MYRLICQKPAHFLSAQKVLVSTFFQIFIVIGMYNFGHSAKCSGLQLPDDGINVKRFDRPKKKYLGIIFKSIKPIFGQSKRVEKFPAIWHAQSHYVEVTWWAKICIKYRKHGSSSFSHTFNCVCVSLFLISNYLFIQKLPLFIALYHVTFQSGP